MYMPKSARPASGYMPRSAQPVSQKKGIGSWFTNGKKGVEGVLAGAGNLLNLPSYAIGGVLDSVNSDGLQASDLNIFKSGIQGIKNKKAVMSELPETFGVDPNSLGGKALGFGGELLTPGLPIGKAINVFRGAKNASKVANAGSDMKLLAKGAKKLGGGIKNVASNMSISALRLPEGSINAIEEAFKMPIDEVVRKYDLFGGKGQALPKVGSRLTNLNAQRASTVGSDMLVDSTAYSNALRKRAEELKKIVTPEAQSVADDIFERANLWDETYKGAQVPISAIDLTRKAGFENVSSSALGKVITPAGKTEASRVAIDVLDELSPGAREIGKEQRALIELQDRLKSAPSGRGNLLVSGFKPAIAGLSTGTMFGMGMGNPLLGAGLGLAASVAANNPKVLSIASRAGNKASRVLGSQKAANILNTTQKVVGKVGSTGIRVATQPSQDRSSTQPLSVLQSQSTPKLPYQPPIRPQAPTPTRLGLSVKRKPVSVKSSVSSNISINPNKGSGFGRAKQVKRGSFY